MAARGIDVSLVSHVINFEIGTNYENYIHRIGRTGRAEQTGIAISLVNRAEEYHLSRIEKLIAQKIEEIPLPSHITEQPYLPFEEKDIARELDLQRQRHDPAYKGAFHVKKSKQKKDGKRGGKKNGRR